MYIPSPLVENGPTELVEEIDAEFLVYRWRKVFDIDVSAEFGGLDTIKRLRCEQTGLEFFYPHSVAGSGDLYTQLQRYDWYYMADKWEHQQALKDMRADDPVLEVGAGDGDFVRHALSEGVKIVGTEINEDAVLRAQKLGLPVELMNLEEAAELHKDKMGIVVSFQVLEHVANPREFIELSLRILKPGGYLVLSVPNRESFIKHAHDNLLDMPPHHMTRWSASTFQMLPTIFPVRVESIRYEPLQPYHVDWYLVLHERRLRTGSRIGHIVLNQKTISFWKLLFDAGLRKRIKGHSIYVKLQKLA